MAPLSSPNERDGGNKEYEQDVQIPHPMCLGIGPTHLWNCTGGINKIFAKDIPSVSVMMMVLESAL